MTLASKAMFYSIYLFIFLNELHHLHVAFVPCLQIFFGPQAQTPLISGTGKGEERNTGM